MRIRSILSTFTAVILVMTAFQGATAQLPDSPDVQAQAAAMTLSSEDLPTGFMLTGETFLALPDATTVIGVTAHYVSVYTNIDSGQQIRSYIYLFEDESQATDGMEQLEGNEPDTLSDTAIELGSGNAELTTGTYESVEGRSIGTADVTFMRGNAVAGVAVDNPDGSEPDGQLATDLANLKDGRIQQVQGGESPVDLALPAQVVPVTDGGVLLQVGFLSPGESEAIYATQGSALSGLESSWVQTVAFGEEGAAPRVTIGVTTFATAEEAADVVEQSDNIFQPLADQEKILDASVDGADSVVAYRYTSRDGNIAELESYRIIFSQGELVTVVDVQGAPDSGTAEAAANTIARGQIMCQSSGTCDRPIAPGVIPGE
jgi:hypothetical protein